MDTQADIIKRGFITGANGEQLALGSQQATNFLLNQGASIAQPKMNAGTPPSSTVLPPKDFTALQKESFPSEAMIGGTSVKDILAKRSQLEQDFVNASKQSETEIDLTSQLNTAKQLSRKGQLAYLDETRRIREASGGTTAGASEFLSDVSRRYADESARQGIGLSGLADALNAEVGRRQVTTDGITKQMQFSKDNINLLKDLQTMTMPTLVGSPQVNEMTGEVTVFQQDPQTGAITSSVVGNVGASKKYIQSGTYEDSATKAQMFWGLNPNGQIEIKSLGGGSGATSPMADAQKAQDQISFLRDTARQASQLSGASGASGISKFIGGAFKGDTKFKQLEALTNTLRTNVLTLMTDPDIKKFFGPQMSEADVRLMTAAGTTLNPESQSPAQLQKEIGRLDALFGRMQSAVQSGTAGGRTITAPNGEEIIITD